MCVRLFVLRIVLVMVEAVDSVEVTETALYLGAVGDVLVFYHCNSEIICNDLVILALALIGQSKLFESFAGTFVALEFANVRNTYAICVARRKWQPRYFIFLLKD